MSQIRRTHDTQKEPGINYGLQVTMLWSVWGIVVTNALRWRGVLVGEAVDVWACEMDRSLYFVLNFTTILKPL